MRYDYSEVYGKLGDLACEGPEASGVLYGVPVVRVPIERGYNFLQFRINGKLRNLHNSALYLSSYFSEQEREF